eukprot:m.179955 g.179955  ORF g.179955 m.179955 type:complete len:906 (+) comp53434_c0_seq5:853-3570(+)
MSRELEREPSASNDEEKEEESRIPAFAGITPTDSGAPAAADDIDQSDPTTAASAEVPPAGSEIADDSAHVSPALPQPTQAPSHSFVTSTTSLPARSPSSLSNSTLPPRQPAYGAPAPSSERSSLVSPAAILDHDGIVGVFSDISDSLHAQFQPRGQIITCIQRHLAQPAGSVALTGPSGCGKTWLAHSLAAQGLTKGTYSAVLHFDASSEAELMESYRRCAADLRILIEQNETSSQVVLKMHTRLETPETPGWLAVFDNVRSEEDLLSLLHPQSLPRRPRITKGKRLSHPPGHVLLLSRVHKWASSPAVPVGIFSSEEAAGFLRRRLPQSRPNDCALLLRTVGYHPLTLSLSAAFIGTQSSMGRFLQAWRCVAERILVPASCAIDNEEQNVFGVVQLIIDAIAEDRAAIALLRLMCVLSSASVSEQLLLLAFGKEFEQSSSLQASIGELPRSLAADTSSTRVATTFSPSTETSEDNDLDPNPFRAAIAKCIGCGLLLQTRAQGSGCDDSDTRCRGFAMPSLLQKILRSLFGERGFDLRNTRLAWISVLTEAANPNWIKSSTAQAHSVQIIHFQSSHIDAVTSPWVVSDLVMASSTGLDESDSKQQDLSEWLSIATLLFNLGGVAWLHRSYSRAENLFGRALLIRKCVLGDQSDECAQSLDSIGRLYFAQGFLERAFEAHSQALQIRQSLHGAEHVATAISLTNLGAIHWRLNRHEEALTAHREALRIRSGVLGDNHNEVANATINIGLVLHSKGLFIDALRLYEDALRMKKAALGADHEEVAVVLGNIGNALNTQGKYDDAVIAYQEALQILRRVHGARHVAVACSLNNNAAVLYNKQQYQQALDLYLEALDIFTSLLPATHLHISQTRRRMHETRGALQGSQEGSLPTEPDAPVTSEATSCCVQ